MNVTDFYIRAALLLAFIPIWHVQADQAGELWPLAKTKNVKSGDPDYPQINPHPTRVLQLRGALPKALGIEFMLQFEASPDAGGTIQSGNYCGYVERAPVFPLFHLAEPLHMVRKDSTYNASIPIDKYLPGRCNWHLSSIAYRIVNGGANFSGDEFAAVYDPKVIKVPEQELYRGEVNIWCTKKPFRADSGQHERCTTFPILKEFVPIQSEALTLIPAEERAGRHLTWVFPDTQWIVMNFHDLDVVHPGR
jgi:hypothetical protein